MQPNCACVAKYRKCYTFTHNMRVTEFSMWYALIGRFFYECIRVRVRKPPYKKEFQTLVAHDFKSKWLHTKLTWIKYGYFFLFSIG